MRPFVFVVGGLLLLTACSPDVSDSETGAEVPTKTVSGVPKSPRGTSSPGRSSASRKSPHPSPLSRIPDTTDGVFHPPPVDGVMVRPEGRGNAVGSSTSGTMPTRSAPPATTVVSSSTLWKVYRWKTITTTWTHPSRGRGSNAPGSGSSTVYGLVPPTELISIVSSATSTVSSTVRAFIPGALCSVYRVRRRPVDLKSILMMLDTEAEMIAQEYDMSSCDFDGRSFSQYGGNLFLWEGVFMARRAGKYTFCLADRKNFVCFTIGGVTSLGNFTGERNTFKVNLSKGPNNIQVIVMFYDDNQRHGTETGNGRVAPFFTYRPPVSDEGFKFDDDDEDDDELMNKVTPAILYYAVEDGEGP